MRWFLLGCNFTTNCEETPQGPGWAYSGLDLPRGVSRKSWLVHRRHGGGTCLSSATHLLLWFSPLVLVDEGLPSLLGWLPSGYPKSHIPYPKVWCFESESGGQPGGWFQPRERIKGGNKETRRRHAGSARSANAATGMFVLLLTSVGALANLRNAS